MNNAEFKKILLGKMHIALKAAGFRKNGHVFSSQRDDGVLFLQLQSSSKSTRDVLIATVNLGIFSRTLALKIGNTRKPNILAAHWSERLGHFLPDANDKWWEVRSDEQANAVGEEIGEIVRSRALREMCEIASTAGLKALWETGQCPGLTAGQRQQYLRVLND